MTAQTAAHRLSWLRGTLPAAEPGARGLEKLGRNPGCQRLRALTMVGTTPALAMGQVYGLPVNDGQSPFALTIGVRYEARLLEHGAGGLLALLRAEGRLAVPESKVVIVPDLAPGTTPVDLARREAITRSLLRRKLQGDPNAPNVIVKGRLGVSLLGIDHGIEPDVLTAADAAPFYRTMEIKSIADRDGKTDVADLRGACRQAAVEVVGMREAARRLGVARPDQLVPAVADLVLRKPGSMTPTLRAMAVPGEVDSVERVLQAAPSNLQDLEALVQAAVPGGQLDDRAVLDAIPATYQPTCREHCALAPYCKEEARQRSEPILLGRQAREELAPAGSLSRALDLLDGTGGPPRTAAERSLAARLRAADTAWAQAVGVA